MPKVTEEYIQNKKNMIVEAAYKLCLRKTVSTVTMQDIINETGLSQGGIYRFYKDVDAIFSDMWLFLRQKENIKPQVDEIFAMTNKESAGVIINRLFELLGDFMTRELMGIEKLDFEINVLAMNNPERVKNILSGIPGVGNMEYLMSHLYKYIGEQIHAGILKPRVTEDELFSYIKSAFSGVQMTSLIFNCYSPIDKKGVNNFKPDIQLKILNKTVCYLLGVEDEEIRVC